MDFRWFDLRNYTKNSAHSFIGQCNIVAQIQKDLWNENNLFIQKTSNRSLESVGYELCQLSCTNTMWTNRTNEKTHFIRFFGVKSKSMAPSGFELIAVILYGMTHLHACKNKILFSSSNNSAEITVKSASFLGNICSINYSAVFSGRHFWLAITLHACTKIMLSFFSNRTYDRNN